MEAVKNMLTRKSIRKFLTKEVETDKIEIILKCALASPTGRNLQGRIFTVIKSKDKIERLANAMRNALGREKYDFYRPNLLILVTIPRDRVLGESDCAVALQNIYLACHDLGLGSVWINQIRECYDDKDVRRVMTEFEIPEDHISYGLSAIGYPDEDPDTKERSESINII